MKGLNGRFWEELGVGEFDTIIVEQKTKKTNSGFLYYGHVLGLERQFFQNVIVMKTSGDLKEFYDHSCNPPQINVKLTRLVLIEKTYDWTRVI